MASGKAFIGADSTTCCFVSHVASVKFIVESIQLFHQEKAFFIPINPNPIPLGINRLVFDK